MNTLLKTEVNIYRNLNTLGLGILQMPGLWRGQKGAKWWGEIEEAEFISLIFISTHYTKPSNAGLCLPFLGNHITGDLKASALVPHISFTSKC